MSRFSIGFGPTIFSKQIGETEWVISAIPFGGYVMLKDDGPPEASKTAAASDTLSFQRPMITFLIAVSGSIVNFLMALLLVPVLGRMILSGSLTADDFELRSERKKRGCIGPIGILQLTGEAAVRGKGATLALIARFSLGIGMLQLLPIPILDGNQALHSLLASGSGLPYTLPDLIMIMLLIMSTYSLYRLAATRLFFLRQLLPPPGPLVPEDYED